MKSDFLVLEQKQARLIPMYVRLRSDTVKRLLELERKTGIKKAEIAQQCIDFALDRIGP